MDALTQQLMQLLSGGGVSQISQKIGADERTTESALSTAMSLLVSALARNASEPRGAAALHQALAEDHDGSILAWRTCRASWRTPTRTKGPPF